jgi:hypothetical protein
MEKGEFSGRQAIQDHLLPQHRGIDFNAALELREQMLRIAFKYGLFYALLSSDRRDEYERRRFRKNAHANVPPGVTSACL